MDAAGISPVGMAQDPARQQPQPVLSHGMFFWGACFCAVVELAGIGMSGIIIEGDGPAALEAANDGNAPPRDNPRATSSAMTRRPTNFSIAPC